MFSCSINFNKQIKWFCGLGLGNKTLGVNNHIDYLTPGANSIVGYNHPGVCYDAKYTQM